MAVKNSMRKKLSRLLNNRRGTAEIVGSVMFLLIMMFFFTNVFLWHDRATRKMDSVLSEKMNSPVSIQVVSMNVTPSEINNEPNMTLAVTNNGGVEAVLSRLWIITDGEHNYADLETGQEIRVVAGAAEELYLSEPNAQHPEFSVEGQTIYYVPDVGMLVTFKILTTRGNMAARSSTPYE